MQCIKTRASSHVQSKSMFREHVTPRTRSRQGSKPPRLHPFPRHFMAVSHMSHQSCSNRASKGQLDAQGRDQNPSGKRTATTLTMQAAFLPLQHRPLAQPHLGIFRHMHGAARSSSLALSQPRSCCTDMSHRRRCSHLAFIRESVLRKLRDSTGRGAPSLVSLKGRAP